MWDKSDQEAKRHRVTVSGSIMKECDSHSREGSNGQLSRDRCEMLTKRVKTASSNATTPQTTYCCNELYDLDKDGERHVLWEYSSLSGE